MSHIVQILLVGVFILLSFGFSTAALAQGDAASKDSPGKGQTRAQQLFGDIAPKMAQLTDDVLYGDVWERLQLSKRDRSLATVSALVAMNCPEQLRSHIGYALRNGVTKEEIAEIITHLAFYSGWPKSVTALRVAKEVFDGK